MKLLRVSASHFKNCQDNFTIDLVAKSKKTAEDKEYELQEVAEELFVYSTAAFVGRNASGKTTAAELLDCCYTILGEFRLENKHYSYENVSLDILFYADGFIYRYQTVLKADAALENRAIFTQQHLFRKKYYKSCIKTIFDDTGFTELTELGELPEDTANVFFVLKKKSTAAVYFDSEGKGSDTYLLLFRALKNYNLPAAVLLKIMKIFDENVCDLRMIDDHNFKVVFADTTQILSDKELLYLLSSGTTKGILLYTIAAASLLQGFDLLIDEVENHFHKTLVENLISLYKDKSVNKKNASLIFTTHYCEILDLFNRQDNIWIAVADEKVSLHNMYEDYNPRPELLKSKQFYNNAFQTAVNYESLMDFKRELKQ